MRNNIFRNLANEIAAKVNEAIQGGVEPLAIAMMLRQIADQCDKLAEQFEKQEQEAAAKEAVESEKKGSEDK